jgi:L-seryl-tRNA(Ser) seleniumtransferase
MSNRRREWEDRIRVMGSGMAATNQVPHLQIRWDPSVVKISHADAVRQLREGDSSIEPVPGSYVKDTLEFAPWTFQPGEAEVVTRRLKEILKA